MKLIRFFFLFFSLFFSIINGDVFLSPQKSICTVNYGVKTPASPQYGYGFVEGYIVDGEQSSTITMEINPIAITPYSYTFQTVSSLPCDYHPVYLTTDPSGQNAQPITTNVLEYDANNVLCSNTTWCACGGGSLVWTPTVLSSNLPAGVSYYYECRVHSKMGGPVIVIEASVCDIALSIVGKNALQLFITVGNIVPYMFTEINATMPDFFNGVLSGGPDLLVEPNLNKTIYAHSEFFAQLFNCTDGSLPPYTGPSMEAVHANIAPYVTATEYNLFVNFFLNQLSFYKGNDYDYLYPRFQSLLISQKPYICKGSVNCRTTLCDLYTDLANYTGQSQVWLSNIVNSTLNQLVESLYPNFNGISGPDYFVPGPARTLFIDKMVAFLGRELNCTQTGFPTYTVTDSELVILHQNMSIDELEYEGFIFALLNSFNAAGMAPADQNKVEALLTRPSLFGICNQPDCNSDFLPPVTFVVEVQQPKILSPWKDGYDAAFVIDGEEARNLTLYVGGNYAFKNLAGCDHPIYITTSPYGGMDSTGAPLGAITNGISGTLDPFQICDGNTLYFTPNNQHAAGPQLYYQCVYHERMGYYLTVCTADGTQCSSGSINPGTTTSSSAIVNYAAVSSSPQLILSLILSLLLAFFNV